jgi:threonine dehydrogenase-like Zn-dependent dehydrogenase
VQPIAAGICGSDLSAWQHTDDFLKAHIEADVPGELFDPDSDLVMGHEFTARVLELGEGVADYAVGDRLVVLPWVVENDGAAHTVGYTGNHPGALSDRVVVQAGGHLVIPDGVDAVTAAVTEPMATGVNAVLRSDIGSAANALVIGCGPVGLGAIVELAERGVGTIIASDPSAKRREIARQYGAHIVVDPSADDPVARITSDGNVDLPTYVFEASGVRGMVGSLMESTPKFTRIMVVGSSMVPETVRPVVGILKNVSIEFVGGPGRGELTYAAFSRTFELVVNGRFDPAVMVTGYASIDAVGDVFHALRPSSGTVEHVKVLVRPDLPTGTGLVDATDSAFSVIDKDRP